MLLRASDRKLRCSSTQLCLFYGLCWKLFANLWRWLEDKGLRCRRLPCSGRARRVSRLLHDHEPIHQSEWSIRIQLLERKHGHQSVQADVPLSGLFGGFSQFRKQSVDVKRPSDARAYRKSRAYPPVHLTLECSCGNAWVGGAQIATLLCDTKCAGT